MEKDGERTPGGKGIEDGWKKRFAQLKPTIYVRDRPKDLGERIRIVNKESVKNSLRESTVTV
jgi:hypothetical protein